MDYGSPDTIVTILIAAAIGLAAGYLIWGQNRRDEASDAPKRPAPAKPAAPAPATKPAPTAKPAQAEAKAPANAADPAPAAQTPGESAKPAGLILDGPPERVDDLKRIKGVGPKMEKALHAAGLYQYAQIAKLSPEEQRWLGETLGTFPDRITRDDWVGQAAALHREAHGGGSA